METNLNTSAIGFYTVWIIHDLVLLLLNLIFAFFFQIEFRSGRSPILVATDVAARGLGESVFYSF
jgi:hypothetical protein